MSMEKSGSIRNYLEPQLAAAAGKRLAGAARKSFQSLLKSMVRSAEGGPAAETAAQGLTISEYLRQRVVISRGSASAAFRPRSPAPIDPPAGDAPASAPGAAPRAESAGPGAGSRRGRRSAVEAPTQSNEVVERSIRQAAARYNLSPELIRAVILAESGFNARAVSPAGAQGLMQLMPETASELGVADPFDIRQNIDGGARYLRQMLDRFGGRLETALAAYNAGPGAVEKYDGRVPYAETRDYVRRVMRFAGEAARPRPG